MIEIRVSGFECDPGEIEVGAAGSYGMQQLHFAFSAEWEGLNKRTTWNTDSGPVSVMLDENEVAEVPAEATATAGRRYFSIDGFAEGRQHISVRVTYKVFETVAPGGANSVPPTDSEMTQALAIMQEIRDLKTPEVTVGQTKTVAAAQSAHVVNTGTGTKAVFDFEIPRGESGVYVGSDEPGEDVQLWIVPEGENEIDEGLDTLERAVERVENATVLAPKIGADGTWLVYDAAREAYVDTGVKAQGEPGEKGEPGAKGEKGDTGAQGSKGDTGAQGPKGEKGETGAQGPAGPQGEKGDPGPQGEKGSNGAAGQRGAIYHKVTTAPSSYTTAIGDYTPKYRILISTALSQSGQADMITGDVIRQSYYDYFVDHIEGGYAYISTSRISVRGTNGDDGKDGKGGATVVIGTTRSGHTADDCDYLCDGSADDVEIRTAAQALTNGGEIRLLEGTYVLDSDVEIDATVNIAGCGGNTVIACNSLMLYASNCSVRDLVFDSCSVRMIGENGSASRCQFINTEGDAIKADAASCRVTNNHFSDVYIAIYFGSNSSGCLAAHNTIVGSHDNIMDEGTNNAIIGNIIRDGAGSDSMAIGTVGTGTYITDNVVDMAQVAEPMFYNGTNIIHVNNMVNGGLVDAPSGGASSWNDLTDKPIVVVTLNTETMTLSHTPAQIAALQDAGMLVVSNLSTVPIEITRGDTGEATGANIVLLQPSTIFENGALTAFAMMYFMYMFDANGIATEYHAATTDATVLM